MEDDSDVTHRPDPPLRAMNVRLPSARKLSLVLLTIFVLFALLASSSSFTSITASATSALKLMPSPGKVPIQISNCTFNYVASAASDRRNKNTIYFESWVRNTILGVAWWMISRVFIAVVVLLICTVLHEKLHEEDGRMKVPGRVACLALIHALGFRTHGVKVDTEMSTRVTTSETPYATTVHTTVTLTVTETQSKERPVLRSPLGYHF